MKYVLNIDASTGNDAVIASSVNNISFKRKYFLPLVVVLPLSIFSTGCENLPKNIPKATSFATGGAVAGAMIGAQKGGLTGALVGAAIGGFAGNLLGTHFDEEDRKKLANLELEVLETGKSKSFVTNKSKAYVTVSSLPETVETVKTFNLSSDVEENKLKMTSVQDIVAFVETPVYKSINEKKPQKLTIKKGDSIHVQANVESNSQWAAVMQSDTVIGYIPIRYLNIKNKKSLEAEAKKKLSQDVTKVAKSGKQKNIPNSITPIATVTAPTVAVSEKQVIATAPRVVAAVGVCRVLTRKIDAGPGTDGGIEKVKYCQEPPPKWKTIEA